MQALTGHRNRYATYLFLESIVSVTSCWWEQGGWETKVPKMTLTSVAWMFKSKLTNA